MHRARLAIIVIGLLAGISAAASSVLPSIVPASPSVPSAADILTGVSAADAAMLRDFYAAMADIVVRDGHAVDPVCKTVGDLRNRHKQALQMAFVSTAIVNKYSGLGERLDAYLLKAIGEMDLPLTPELRQSAAKAFASIK
jgi:hypothetical protein